MADDTEISTTTANISATSSIQTPSVPKSGISPKSDTFLKPQSPRKRRRSLGSPTVSMTHPTLRSSSILVSPKSVQPSGPTPQPMTGAAALVDLKRQREEQQTVLSRQTSPNPASKAVGTLLGKDKSNFSRMQHAPNTVNASSAAAPTAPMAQTTSKSEGPVNDHSVRQSPATSTTSVATPGGNTAGAMGTNGMRVASPGEIDQGGASDERSDGGTTIDTGGETDQGESNKALTYPGPLLAAPMTDSRRGMSLPGSGLGRESQRSPSAKKHKCPYCSTEFTRHHNLKSHLLTHSQEKPYYCETCEAKFRRLHDLKRHTKLHTGERPHVCPKCDRSFARGDALARHNKGQGGCAGRRSSMGSFGPEGNVERRDSQGQDDSMHGLMYTGQASHEPEGMDDEMSGAENTGRSLPSIRRHDAPPDQHGHSGSDSGSFHPRQPSTYPPIAGRQPGSGSLLPPGGAMGPGSSASNSPGAQASPIQYQQGNTGPSGFQPQGPNVFAQGGMTESPKPLSPGGAASHQLGHPESGIHRNRSPSLTQQFQQQQFGRRSSTLTNSPQAGLPPPHLPSLAGLTPPDPRFTLHSQTARPSGGQSSPGYPSQPGSQNNSLSSHGTGAPGGSGDGSANTLALNNERLWAYVRTLETKIDRLNDEVSNLKGQLSSRS